MPHLDPFDWATACVMVLIGSALQSLIGFGLAVVAAPILVMLDPTFVPVPLTFAALVLSGLNAYTHREALNFGDLFYATLGRLPGSLLGAWFLSVVSFPVLSMAVGLCVLATIGASVTIPRVVPGRWIMFVAGAISGVMGTATTIGSPPMALVYQHGGVSRLRGNLSAFFVVGAIVSLLLYGSMGAIGFLELSMGLVFAVLSAIGFFLSGPLRKRMLSRHVKPLLQCFCGAAALVVIYRGLG